MLKEGIRNIDIKKIFDNRTRKIEYLERLFSKTDSNFEIPRSVTGLDNCIIDTWDYNLSKDILREMFFCSKKFLSGLDCKKEVDFLINEWYDNNLGEIEWPFSAMIFDSYVARLNRRNDLSETEKDEIIAEDVVKFRRIKDINTKRNDCIESLIVLHNENIIPTFKHNRGLDFYINGEPFDQKVSRSVGRTFENEYGRDYYNIAITHPKLVAKSLYENQDEERFDDDPRLYIVYLDNDISSEAIEQSIIEANFDEPIEITFDYERSRHSVSRYSTYCYIILLHN